MNLQRYVAIPLTALVFAAGCARSDAPEGTPVEAVPPPVESLVAPTWEVQHTDSTVLWIGMSIVDDLTVWVAGTGGRIARTVDGGESWMVITVPGADSLQFRDVHGFSALAAIALTIGNGDDSRIYRTFDGGVTWDLSFKNEDPNAFFDCLSFWDQDRGFAFSDSFEGEFTLLQTNNGGDSWARIDPARVPDARPGEGAFAASGTCVVTRPGGLGWFVTGASGIDSRVIRTTNYGLTWDEAITPLPSNSSTSGISSLTFLDDDVGAAFGGDFTLPDSILDNVAVTADGGATWTLTGPSNLGGSVFGATYVPWATTPTIVAVAPTGSDYSTDNGRTWTRIDSIAYWTVAFRSPRVGWAAGPGRISRIVIGEP